MSEDYVTIGVAGSKKHPIVLSPQEAKEAVSWMHNEIFGHAFPLEAPPELFPALGKPVTSNLEGRYPTKVEPVYDPGIRTATQTVEVKVGDPNLAHQSFKGRVRGDGDAETVDLGALKVGVEHY